MSPLAPTIGQAAALATLVLPALGGVTPACGAVGQQEGATASTAPAPRLDDLAFMSGSWLADLQGQSIEEYWTAPRDGSMVGLLRWMRDGATTMTEHLVIEEDDDGVHMLLRHFNPGLEPWASEAAGPTRFRLGQLDGTRAVFENSRESFPLRIIYHFAPPDALTVRLEGDPDPDGSRAMQFDFRRFPMTTTTTSTETLNETGRAIGYDGGLTIAFQVKDLDASMAWYQDTLGFKLTYKLDEMGWCELSTGVDRVNVGLSQIESPKPGGPTPTFGVRDIDHARAQLEGKGVRFDGPTQEIPGMVKLATFYDPDGNALMLYQTLSEMP